MRVLFRRKRDRDGPRTLVGRWLKAGALRQDGTRESYRDELRRSGWLAADGVAGAAFELAVREAYHLRNTAVDVPSMVAGMREFFGGDGVNRIPQAEGERLIRAALGEDVSVADIPLEVTFTIHSLLVVGLMLDLRCSETEIDAILVRAEEVASDRGFSPTLAR